MIVLFRIFLCASIILGICFATNIDVKDVEIKVFESEDRSIEAILLKSIEDTETLFDSGYFETAMGALGLIDIGPITSIIQLYVDVISDSDAWKRELTKAIADETERKKVETVLFLIKAKLGHIKRQLPFLKGSSKGEHNDRHGTGLIFQNELDEIFGYFTDSTSPIASYPILAAPLLIELALLTATFQPITEVLKLTQHLKLSCQAHDALAVYRSRVVDSRLDMLSTETFDKDILQSSRDQQQRNLVIAKEKSRRSNDIYSNVNSSGVLRCESYGKGCSDYFTILNENTYCISDSFGSNKFMVKKDQIDCMEDYIALLRHNVEKMFPIELLKQICDKETPKKPTGDFCIASKLFLAYHLNIFCCFFQDEAGYL